MYQTFLTSVSYWHYDIHLFYCFTHGNRDSPSIFIFVHRQYKVSRNEIAKSFDKSDFEHSEPMFTIGKNKGKYREKLKSS